VNRVGSARHAGLLRESIESVCGIPVLGEIPKSSAGDWLPSRHLGLVTPREFAAHESLSRSLADLAVRHLDFDGLLKIAGQTSSLPSAPAPPAAAPPATGVTIGYLDDSAFSFYYPENLEALRAAGAALVPISGLTSRELPAALDALYIGGGFPETHAGTLSSNSGLLASIRHFVRAGLPVYAECGGLMLLSRGLNWRGSKYPMAGVFPFDIEVCEQPQGHGYTELLVDTANPFFPAGARLRGHEFHYSRIVLDGDPLPTACTVIRGAGCYAAREAVLIDNVYAAFTHLHALATPEWAQGMIGAALGTREAR